MSSRSPVRCVLVLAALAALAGVPGCVDPPPRAPPAPPSAPAPSPPEPAVPAPSAVDDSARPPVLAWRTGPGPSASVLVAVPPYPARLDEVLPGAWGAEITRTTRLVVLTSPEAAGAVVLRHGLRSARTDLRDVLGETPFTRLASRLGSISGHTHRTALSSMDVRGARLALVLAELGFRAPGEGFLEQLFVRARGEADVVTWLLDTAEFTRFAESASEADVTADLLERIENPSRTADWADAVRAAFASADVAALARACEEPERTESWVETVRRGNRELAATLAEPVARELGGEPTMVALDGCLLAGEAGLLAALRARGVELTLLHEVGAPTAAPEPAPPAAGAPGGAAELEVAPAEVPAPPAAPPPSGPPPGVVPAPAPR